VDLPSIWTAAKFASIHHLPPTFNSVFRSRDVLHSPLIISSLVTKENLWNPINTSSPKSFSATRRPSPRPFSSHLPGPLEPSYSHTQPPYLAAHHGSSSASNQVRSFFLSLGSRLRRSFELTFFLSSSLSSFGLVEEGLYRSGQPTEINFPFVEVCSFTFLFCFYTLLLELGRASSSFSFCELDSPSSPRC